MRKDEYLKYIDPSEFAALYNEWAAKGKPKGNDKLYTQIWFGVTNAVKACIGALQATYHCKYQNYDDKVMDATVLIMTKLDQMTDSPKNIVTMAYLPTLGICCGPKARQKEWEDAMESTDVSTEGGDTFKDLINEDGEVSYINY